MRELLACPLHRWHRFVATRMRVAGVFALLGFVFGALVAGIDAVQHGPRYDVWARDWSRAFVMPEPPSDLLSEDLRARIDSAEPGPWEVAWSDGWDRPMLVERAAHGLQFVSLGRDGRPGGVGLDADLRKDNASTPLELTRRDELAALGDVPGPAAFVAFFAGLLGALVGPPARARGGWMQLVVSLAITLPLCGLVAAVLLMLAEPSGH